MNYDFATTDSPTATRYLEVDDRGCWLEPDALKNPTRAP